MKGEWMYRKPALSAARYTIKDFTSTSFALAEQSIISETSNGLIEKRCVLGGLTMAEYIEREALYRDIESSVVFSVRNAPSAEMRGANKIMERIKCIPAADVAPVVRCKDCKRYFDGISGWGTCKILSERSDRLILGHQVKMPPDGFCYLGERRADNG